MLKHKILIVDDEQGIITMLKDYFEFHGYLVYTAISGVKALKAVSLNPDIILLDINMPDMNGLEVCKLIRNHISCPIIFLTARIEEMEAIIGFQSGGNDYVIKPFKLNELEVRVEAHLRRESRNITKMPVNFFDNLSINYACRQVLYSENVIPLTKKKFDIVELLTKNPGQVFDKERIYEKIWGYDSDNSSIIVEHIRRIRNKFIKYTGTAYIGTVFFLGGLDINGKINNNIQKYIFKKGFSNYNCCFSFIRTCGSLANCNNNKTQLL